MNSTKQMMMYTEKIESSPSLLVLLKIAYYGNTLVQFSVSLACMFLTLLLFFLYRQF